MTVTSDDDLRTLLALDSIAVVGCSSTPGKDAHEIPAFLQRQGYEVIPVNPYADEVLGAAAYDSLSAVDERIDVVDVFRPSEEVPGIVDEVLDRREERDDVRGIWMQLGITHEEAARRAEEVGIQVVQDRCMKVEYRRLMD